MSYDYEMYDGKRINVDGEVIGLLAMEFGREVEEVWKEYHAELAMTEEQERQSEAYKESLRRTLSTQYKKVATLEAENANLRQQLADVTESMRRVEERCAKLRELLIDAYKDMDAWQMVIANSDQWGYGKGCLERLYKLREAMRELGAEVDE